MEDSSSSGHWVEEADFTLTHLVADEDLDSIQRLHHLINRTEQADARAQTLCRIHLLASTFLSGKMTHEGGCKPYDDSVLCWPATALNSTASLPCPSHIHEIAYTTEYNVTRHCGVDGEWEKANYSGCVALHQESDPPLPWIHLRIMYCMYWAGYILSLVFLLLALAIFARYRKLWCLRNIIHSNLILCFALHNVTWIVYSLIANEILTKFYGMEETFCFVPTLLLKYFIAAGFFWMFVEGVYLFISVIFSFHARRIRFWMCALIGWGIPLLLIILTTIIKSQGENPSFCWNEQYHLDYIFIGPVLCVLLINVAFLLIIMYVVVTKLQVTVPVEATRYKKAIKALFILCPLLGVNYIFVLIQPTNPLWAKLIFSYYFTIMTSFQGFLVALLFCFRNNEVWMTIGKSMRRWRGLLRFASQSTLRESVRSDTPSMMMDFDLSSPGRSTRHSVRGAMSSKRTTELQTTKLRNVVVMSDSGEFRLFLPQSYLTQSSVTSSKSQSSSTSTANDNEVRRKRSCPTFRKVSSMSWTNGRLVVDQMTRKRPSTPLLRSILD